jgi:hypothetical protein
MNGVSIYMNIAHVSLPRRLRFLTLTPVNIALFTRTVRILVTEDNQKLAGLLQRGSGEHGHAVDKIYDGEAGLTMAGSVP